MEAEEYFQLPDDGHDYELIDGVVCRSPSPKPIHQKVIARLAAQIVRYIEENPVGEVFVELDVHLGSGPNGTDLVYRPDIIFVRQERVAESCDRIEGAPDLVVEVISPESRRYDHETKKNDYERCGILEYWLIDPQREIMIFYRLQGSCFAQITPTGEAFRSEAIPGFILDLHRIRRAFKPE